jgi:hypothetical protein
MRIFNRAHVPWFIFVVLATIAACWLYTGNFHPERLPAEFRLPPALVQKPSEHHSVGGTPLGLIFGAISFAIFVFATLFGMRKRVVLWRLGTVQRWMRAHIWLTLLTIPLVILHSGFRLGGPMTTLLMALYTIVMVSGIYGLVLQHQIPHIMKERLLAETVFEQIPHIRSQLCVAAEKMRVSFEPAAPIETAGQAPAAYVLNKRTSGSTATASTADELSTATAGAKMLVGSPITAAPIGTATAPAPDPESETVLVEFLEWQVLPYLRARRGGKFRLNNSRFSDDTFRFLKLQVGAPYRSRIEEIQAWCDERRLLELQTRLHYWLHGWLFVHVPFSFLLLIVTAWHAFVTLFYY